MSDRNAIVPSPSGPRHDLTQLARRCQEDLDLVRLQQLANRLGVSASSMCQLGIGWSIDSRAWTLPMYNATGFVVGIRLRLSDGRLLTGKGGKDSLFRPSVIDTGSALMVADGFTNAAALLDLGFFSAVGRPSCTHGIKPVVELVQWCRPADVTIVSDGDESSQRGAANLSSVLVLYAPMVRVITPPAGVKSALEWKRAGATQQDLRAAIDMAPVRRLRNVPTEGRG